MFLKKYELKGYRLNFRSKYRAADIEKKKNSLVTGALFEISKSDEKKLDIYEDFPTLYTKIYFKYYNKKVMTYIMVKKTEFKYPTEKANREILVSGSVGKDSRLLLQMVGERITDGETEASLNYVLNDKLHPGLYVGKSPVETPVNIKLTIDKSKIEQPLQSLVGKIIYIPQFYKEKPTADITNFEFIDDSYTFDVAHCLH